MTGGRWTEDVGVRVGQGEECGGGGGGTGRRKARGREFNEASAVFYFYFFTFFCGLKISKQMIKNNLHT